MTVGAALAAPRIARKRLRAAWLSRIRKRRGEVSLPFQFEYRNIFVMPTKFGAAFGVMLVFMALGGLNFNNNMALMLVFVLAVIAQMTTVLAYRNLVGLGVEAIHAEPVFCGETAQFRVYLSNPDARPRFTVSIGSEALCDCRDLGPGETGALNLPTVTRERGWCSLEPFRLETRFPLGLFRAWCWFFPTARCLVYPTPAEQAPPLPTRGRGHSGRAVKGDGEQIHGLREYRRGDSIRRVAWRTSARHGALYTREMEAPQEEACELSWNLLSGLDTETRLRVLTRWVLLAEHHQLTFSLELPGASIPPGHGPDHRSRCLEALALHGLP